MKTVTPLIDRISNELGGSAGPKPRGRKATPTLSIGIVGLGYVGLPSAIAVASTGAHVIGVDVQPERIAAIESERVDLLDSDRRGLRDALAAKAFTLSTDPAVLRAADAIIICVPTPVDEHQTPDLRALSSACRSVVEVARAGQTILLTSTSYVGTTRDLLVEPLIERGFVPGHDIFVAFSPERIDPGNSQYPHQEVPRVLGGQTPACSARAGHVLRLMTNSVHEVGSPEAAELTKLYENTFRAVNIALANEIADVCSALSVPVTEVIDAASTKPYGFMPFAPGPGVGGHCIPCDPHYLLWQLRSERFNMPLIESAMREIAFRPGRVVRRIGELLGEQGKSLRDARVLLVGIAYKPGVEDVRESPALEIMERLTAAGAIVSFVDSYVPEVRLGSHVLTSADTDDADLVGSTDIVLLHTRHPKLDMAWLDQFPLILDATYRAVELTHRVAI